MWSSSWSLLLSPSFFRVVSSFFGLGKCVRAQLEQSIKNGRDIRPGNCRPFLSGSRRPREGGTERGQGRRSRARPLTSAVLSTDTFLWRRASLAVGSFHGDLIRPLLVTRTRRQAEQREQTKMDLIICGRPRE